MLAWMVVVGAWCIGLLALTYIIDKTSNSRSDTMEWVAAISALVLTGDGVWFLIWSTLWYLKYMQAWPFIPS